MIFLSFRQNVWMGRVRGKISEMGWECAKVPRYLYTSIVAHFIEKVKRFERKHQYFQGFRRFLRQMDELLCKMGDFEY